MLHGMVYSRILDLLYCVLLRESQQGKQGMLATMTLESHCRNSTPSDTWERRLQTANILSRVINEDSYGSKLLEKNILKLLWLRPSRRLFCCCMGPGS